jgi:hypothetical protein
VGWSGGGTFLSLAAWAALGRHPENALSTALWQGLAGAGGTGTYILIRQALRLTGQVAVDADFTTCALFSAAHIQRRSAAAVGSRQGLSMPVMGVGPLSLQPLTGPLSPSTDAAPRRGLGATRVAWSSYGFAVVTVEITDDFDSLPSPGAGTVPRCEH